MTLTTASMAGYYSQTTRRCHCELDGDCPVPDAGNSREDNQEELDSRFHGNDKTRDKDDRDDCKCGDEHNHEKNSRTKVAMAIGEVGGIALNITESVPASVGYGNTPPTPLGRGELNQVFNNGRITDSSILWQYALPVSASATFSYTVTMPQTASAPTCPGTNALQCAGSYTFTTAVWYEGAGQGSALPLREYGSYPFTITVAIAPNALLKEIISDVKSLRVKRTDNENKEEVLELLNKLQAEQDTVEPHEAVEIILKAIDELMKIKSVDITQEII